MQVLFQVLPGCPVGLRQGGSRLRNRFFPCVGKLPHQVLHLAHRQVLFDDLVEEAELEVRVGDADQGAGMSVGDEFLPDGDLHLGRELQKADVVGDGGPVLPDPFAQLLLGEVTLLQQPVVADGDLDGVEVLAVDVLDERQLQHLLVVGDPDVAGDLFKAGDLRCFVAPLPGDQLVFVVSQLAHRHRLDHALLAD